MSLWDAITGQAKAQFLDVIQWVNEGSDTVVYRFPIHQQAITDGSKLTVREGQAAVFLNEGKMSDVFGPGTYELNTRNAPIAAFFASIKYGLNTPYKGDIFFVSTRQFTDQKWGTPNPIPIRDKDLGVVRIRAFGNYAWRVTDPAAFLRELVGAAQLFTTDEINGQLKRKLVSALADTIGESKIALFDLVAQYMDLGDAMRQRLTGWFQENYGITLTDFVVENISVPPEVEKMIDKRSQMGLVGDMNAYTQMQAADAMRAAAERGGGGSPFMAAGMGMAMGGVMGQQMAQAMQPGQPPFNPQAGFGPPPAPNANPRFHYSGPGAGQGEYGAEEIAGFIKANPGAQHMVWANGWPQWRPWSEVPELSRLASAGPPPRPPGPPPHPGAGGPPPRPVETSFHYAASDGSNPTLTSSEIAQRVMAEPGGQHLVWRQGFAAWTPAREVAEIAALLPPPRA